MTPPSLRLGLAEAAPRRVVEGLGANGESTASSGNEQGPDEGRRGKWQPV
jgi:hypothetical protein